MPKLIKEAAPGRRPSAFYAVILRQTKRGSKAVTSDSSQVQTWSDLVTTEQRDLAYGGGNILELYKAVLTVIAVHWGPFGRSGLPPWSELLSWLTGLLPKADDPKSTTETPSSAGVSGSSPQSG